MPNSTISSEVLIDAVRRADSLVQLKVLVDPASATIADRMRYLIATHVQKSAAGGAEDSKRRGLARLLAELEKQSGVAESRWRDFVRGKSGATETLIAAVGRVWPEYAMWMVVGVAGEGKDPTSVTEGEG